MGFTSDAFGDYVRRLHWGVRVGQAGGTRYAAPYVVRAVREALARNAWAGSRPCVGMHTWANELAREANIQVEMDWVAMWREGWTAPWPAAVRDMWWRMAAGAVYTAHNRVHWDADTAGCRECGGVSSGAPLDTHYHWLLECPSMLPVWTWARAMMQKLGVEGHPSLFMLYGTQAIHQAGEAPEVGVVQRVGRRGTEMLRGAIVEAVYRRRMRVMRPEGGDDVAEAFVTAMHAKSVLKAHVQSDWHHVMRGKARGAKARREYDARRVATRSGRPQTVTEFAQAWAGMTSVRGGGHVVVYVGIVPRAPVLKRDNGGGA